jgi:hypothetical protein
LASTKPADTSTSQTPASNSPVDRRLIPTESVPSGDLDAPPISTSRVSTPASAPSLKDILVDANLMLKEGFKYGTAGRNGVEKSGGKSGECSLC